MNNKQTMETQPKAEVDGGDKFEEIFNLLEEGDKRINVGTYADVVLVLGNTGSGKSTLTQFIAGDNDQLISREVGEDTGVFVIDDTNGRVSTATTSSLTIFPELVVDAETNAAFYDCPGFDDTRSTAHDLASTYLIKKVIDNSENVKLVFTVNHSSLTPGVDRSDFTKLVRHATAFMKNIDKFEHSIALIATKVENRWRKGKLVSDRKVIKAIADFLREVKETMRGEQSDSSNGSSRSNERGIKLIDTLLFQKAGEYVNIGIFRRPEDAGVLSQIVQFQDGKKSLEKVVYENIQYASIGKGDFGYTISERSMNDIHGLVEEINHSTTSDVMNLGKEIQKYYIVREKQTDDVYKLQNAFKSGYDVLSHTKRAMGLMTKPREIVEKVIKNVNDLDISISERSLLRMLKQDKCLEVIQVFSNNALTVNPSQWEAAFRDMVEYLDDSKKWYGFLINLYASLSEYKIQENIGRYRVTDYKDQDIIRTNQRIKISESKLRGLIDAIQGNVGQYSTEYNDIIKMEVDGFRLRKFNKILDLTLSHKVHSACPTSDKLEVRGEYVKLSAINFSTSGCSENIKFLEIFALNTVFMDADLNRVGDKLQVSIIAPKWEIIGKSRIVLDGVSGQAHEKSKADDAIVPSGKGKDGKPGLPGGAAGHFFGIGGKFVKGEHLTISTNGGTGGPAQDGGNGADGMKGQDASKELLKLSTEEREAKGFKTVVPGHLYESNIPRWAGVTLTYGLTGGKGGNGGNGGVGGEGGNQGILSTIGLFEDTEILIVSRKDKGLNGKGGVGGQGGSGGQQGDTLQSWKSAYVTINSKRENKTRNASGENGVADKNTEGMKNPEDSPLFLNPSNMINSYKNYVRENLIDSARSQTLTEFIDRLETHSEVTGLYDTLGFVNELQGLEDQFYRLKNDLSFLPYHQSLLLRLSSYAQNPKNHERSQEYKKALSYIYSATLSKICSLKESSENDLIINTKGYLKLAKNNIINLKEAANQVAINEYNAGFQGAINKKIEEANGFIDTQITPEMERNSEKIYNRIDSLIIETIELQRQTNVTEVQLLAQRRKLENAMVLKKVFGAVEIGSQFLGLLGPVGTAAGIAIAGGVKVAGSLVLDNEGAGGNGEVPKLPAGIRTALVKMTRRMEEEQYVFRNQLNDALSELEKYSDKYPESLTTIRDKRQVGNSSASGGQSDEHPRSFLTTIRDKILEIRIRLGREIRRGAEYYLESVVRMLRLRKELGDVLREEQELVEQGPSRSDNKDLLETINYIKNIVCIVDVGLKTYNDIRNQRAKIDEMSKAIELAKENISQLEQYHRSIYTTIIPVFEQLKKDMEKLATNLANKSHIAFEVSRWQIQSSLKEVKFQINQMTKGFEVQEDLNHCIEKLGEGMSTMINLYDRIEYYYDQASLAAYIADVSSAKAEGIQVNNKELKTAIQRLNLITKSNLLLAQYERATNAFKQFVFPFADYYLAEFSLPSDLTVDESVQNLVFNAQTRIESMASKLAASIVSTHPAYEKDIYHGDFYTSVDTAGPFHVWENERYTDTISNLLMGKVVTVKADILKGTDENAVKFNLIGMHLRSTNETKQGQLDEHLHNFDVEITHLGGSHYRCGNKFYIIISDKQPMAYSFAKNAKGKPIRTNAVYDKIRNGDFTLSPYSMWNLKLVNRTADGYSKLVQYANQVDLELEGHAQYVAQNADVCDSKLDKYYKVEDTMSEVNDIDMYNRRKWHEMEYVGGEPHATHKRSLENHQVNNMTTVKAHHRERRAIGHREADFITEVHAGCDHQSQETDEGYSFVTSGTASFMRSSPINNIINWLSSSAVLLKLLDPLERIRHWIAEKDTATINYSQYHLNDTLTLADFVIRKLTKVKICATGENSRNLLEVQGEALSIMTEFEKILHTLSGEFNESAMEELEFDPIAVQKSLVKEIVNDNHSKISGILYNSVMKNATASIDAQFCNCLKDQMADMLEKQKYDSSAEEQPNISRNAGDQIQVRNMTELYNWNANINWVTNQPHHSAENSLQEYNGRIA